MSYDKTHPGNSSTAVIAENCLVPATLRRRLEASALDAMVVVVLDGGVLCVLWLVSLLYYVKLTYDICSSYVGISGGNEAKSQAIEAHTTLNNPNRYAQEVEWIECIE